MDALRAFGAIVDKSYEGIRITAPNGLHGANIELPYPSVGATEQVLLTAVRAEGVTELRNAAMEPEIDLSLWRNFAHLATTPSHDAVGA